MAVSIKIGILLLLRLSEMAKSEPDSRGIMRSRTIRSNSIFFILARATSTLSAVVTRKELSLR